MSFLAIILGAFGRASVGGGWLSRGYVYPLAAALSAYVGFGLSWWALPFGIVAALTFWIGRTDWVNAPYMVARYGAAPASLALIYAYLGYGGPGWYYPLLWGLSCLLVGWLDGRIRLWVHDYELVIRERYSVDGARVAELVDGAVVIGGVALL